MFGEPIVLTGFGTLSHAVRKIQSRTMSAYPADPVRWVSNDQGVVWNVLGYHAARSDKSPMTDGRSRDDGAIGSEGCPLQNACRFEISTSHDRTWVANVRKDAAWPQEYVRFECDAVVETYVVLNSTAVANDH